jgi:pimeloyl-ACP methyl ester carboxylesterase
VKGTLGLQTNVESIPSVEEQWVSLDGIRVRYLRSGSGPPLVLLHGLLGYSFSWRFVMPALAQQATVYAIDMPGAGFSERPAGLDCRLRASATRLLQFLDAVGLTACDLLGTSQGGAVAMMAAAIAPHRVHRLILVNPVNPWSAPGRRRARFLSSRAITPLFLRLAPHLRITHSHILRRLYGDPLRILPGTLEGYSAPFTTPGAFANGLGVLRSWNQDLQQLKTILPQIGRIPTLMVWGSVDRAVAPGSAHELLKHFQNCRLVILEGVGHLPYEEVPEEFNRVVAEFLKQPFQSVVTADVEQF